MERYTGSCLCGKVQLAVTGAPYRIGLCHCFDCRKHHGAVFQAFAIFPRAGFTVAGDTRHFRDRHFCPECGSLLFAGSGDEIEMNLGCLDKTSQFTPTYECWTIRREAWLPPFGMPHLYEHDREGAGRRED